MNNLNIYRDRRIGGTGSDGADGIGVTDVRGSIMENPMLSAMNDNELSSVGNVGWSRSTEALNTDRYGNLEWVPASSITNLAIRSSQYLGFWFDTSNSWTAVTGETDPFGGSDAEEITLDLDTTGTTYDVVQTPTSIGATGKYYTISFWLRVKTGTIPNLDIKVNGNIIQSAESVTTSFKRFTFNVALTSSTSVSINPRAASGTKFVLYGFQFQLGSVATDYIDTGASAVTEDYTGKVERVNEKGYLVEDSKENLSINSEDLSLWTVSSGTITTATDPFGFENKNIKINWSTEPTITISNPLTYTAGLTYTVSFYAHLTAGSISAATAQIGDDGALVAFDQFSTSGFTRLSVQVVAGTAGDLLIKLTSSGLSAVPLITNIQVELGALSSYVRNGSVTNTRGADVPSALYSDSMPQPSGEWTFLFTHDGIVDDATLKYIFDNGESGVNSFAMWFQDSDLRIKNSNETEIISNAISLPKIGITFDGVNLKVYSAGVVFASAVYSLSSEIASTNVFFGTNSANTDSINARLKNLIAYDVSFSGNEMRYIMEN